MDSRLMRSCNEVQGITKHCQACHDKEVKANGRMLHLMLHRRADGEIVKLCCTAWEQLNPTHPDRKELLCDPK